MLEKPNGKTLNKIYLIFTEISDIVDVALLKKQEEWSLTDNMSTGFKS